MINKNTLEDGFTLIDFMVTMALVASLMAGVFSLSNMFLENQRSVMAGSVTNTVFKSANKYIEDNFQIISDLTDTAAVRISMFTLINSGYLNPNLAQGSGADLSVVNNLGQEHHVLVRKNTQGNLESVLVAKIDDEDQRVKISRIQQSNIARSIGAFGGIVSEDECGTVIDLCVLGNNGILKVDLSDFDSPGVLPYLPADGDVAAVSFFGQSGLIKPYLYRMDVGNADANKMITNMDMANNNILNVNDMYVTSRGMWLSEALSNTYTVPTGQTIFKPTCTDNAPVPRIYLSQQIFTDAGNNYPISGAYVTAEDFPTYWVVRIGVTTQEGYQESDPDIGRAQVEIRCSPV